MIGIRLADSPRRRIPGSSETSVPEPYADAKQQRSTKAHQTVETSNSDLGVDDGSRLNLLSDGNLTCPARMDTDLERFFPFEHRNETMRKRHFLPAENGPVGKLYAEADVIEGYILSVVYVDLPHVGGRWGPLGLRLVQIVRDFALVERQRHKEKGKNPGELRDALINRISHESKAIGKEAGILLYGSRPTTIGQSKGIPVKSLL